MSEMTIEVKNDAMLGRLNEKSLHLNLIEQQKEIERLNKEKDDLDDYNRHLRKEKENLNNIVANKIIEDYDIETPLKEQLNTERINNIGLRNKNKRLNNIINELKEDIVFCINGMKNEYACTDGRTNRELHTMVKILEESLDKIKELKDSDK